MEKAAKILEKDIPSVSACVLLIFSFQVWASGTHIAYNNLQKEGNVWEWLQRFHPKQVYPCERIAAFLIDGYKRDSTIVGMSRFLNAYHYYGKYEPSDGFHLPILEVQKKAISL